jgi:hypothetical protein
MGVPLIAQVVTAVAVPLLAVWWTVRATSRETTRAIRAEVSAQRLTALADDLARTSRDLRDLLFAGDACASCGAGVSARQLIDLATHIDRTIDLALLHVRDEELRQRLYLVLRAAGDVTRHKKNLVDPCDELLTATYSLVAICDRVAEQSLNLVHEGRAVVPPRVPMTLVDRLLTAAFG